MEWQESLWARAYRDTKAALHSPIFLLGDLVISAGVGAVLAGIGDDMWLSVGVAMLGGLVTFVLLIVLWFSVNVPIALVKQRGEARRLARSALEENGTQQLIRVTPNQGSNMRPTSQGTTVWEIDAYLDVETIDQRKPLRNCRIKLLELEHYYAYTDKDKEAVIERWNQDSFYGGQTCFFCWSGRPDTVEAVDVHKSERASIARCVDTVPELTTTAGKVGHLFHGDQYHLIVEITADNSLPLTKEYWLKMHEGNGPVIEEWDANPRSGLGTPGPQP